MSRTYANFVSDQAGPSLDVARGGIVLTTIAPGLSGNRTAILTVGQEEYESYAEFIVYGLAGTIITNKVAIGLATDSATLSGMLGENDQSIAYRLAEGKIRHNAGDEAAVASGVLGDAVGIRLSNDTVTFYKNGIPLTQIGIPAAMLGQPLYLAASIGSDVEPGDIQIQVNPGRDWFEYDVGVDGWWETHAVPSTLRFSDDPYISPGSDPLPYQRWEGGITEARIEDDRGVHFWIWGRGGQARGSAAVVEVLDSEGRLNQALGGVFRDQPANLQLADGTDLGGYIVDTITISGPMRRKITLKGPLAQFDVPMLRRAIRPDADPDAVGYYYPMLIGPVFSAPPRLIDKASRIYALDAVGADAVGKVRDSGFALDFSSGDYTLGAGGTQLELANEPSGTVTVDASATGEGYVPPEVPDVIGGDGNPFVGITGTGSFPDNWTAVTPSEVGAESYVDNFGRWVFPRPTVKWAQVLKHNTAVLQAGTTYQFEFDIDQLEFHPSAPSEIRFLVSPTGQSWYKVVTLPLYSTAGISADGQVYPPLPQKLVGKYTPTTTHEVVFSWSIQTGAGAFPEPTAAIIRSIVFKELPPPETGSEDDVEAEIAARALPLAEMLQEGISVRCRMPSSVWDKATAEAVDIATGYTGQGYWSSEQLTLRDYVENILAPYTASFFEAKDGKGKVARLVDPETVPVTGVPIKESDVLNEPDPRWDDMPGLTVTIGCRRNEHVFSADELADGLPWAARPKLTKPYRYQRRYGGPLAPGMEHARAADTLDSRLVAPEDAQAAIDHVGKLAQVQRAFFDVQVPDPWRWEVGEVVDLELPSWFPEGTRKVYITRIRNGRQETGTLTVWTRAPWET